MNLVGKKAHIARPLPLKMQRKNPKHSLYLGPNARKNLVPPFLLRRKRSPSTSLSQDATKYTFLAASLPEFLFVIGLVGKDGRLISFKQFINHLGIVDISRSTYKFGDKSIFGINGQVIFVAIDSLLTLFGEGGIIVLAGASGGLDQTGVNDFSGPEFKALLGKLTFKLLETLAIEIHGLEVGAEARDGRVIRHGVNGREAEETAVEEVAFELEFYFGVGVAVDLLDDEDFEHHDGVIGFTTDLSGVQRSQDFLEGMPIDELIDARENIFR